MGAPGADALHRGGGLDEVRVGLVGAGFMAMTHSFGLRAASALYADELPPARLVRLAARTPESSRSAAERLGWGDWATDWKAVTRADDVDVVVVVTPNASHAEIAIDAAQHGKHVVCEKPLATTVEDARAMLRAADEAGVSTQVGFVYRTWPAVALARQLIADGRIGVVRDFRGRFLHDFALDPAFPSSWRMRHELSGGGSVMDIGSHVFDLARSLVGEPARVFAQLRTHVRERPDERSGRPVAVDVDDAARVLVEFAGGATGVVETSWVAAGCKMDVGFEVTGDAGTLSFSWQRNGELELYVTGEPSETEGFRTIVVGPQHRGADGIWPVAGMGLGYGDAFTVLARDLLGSLAAGTAPSPDFHDGVRALEVVAAAQRSAAEGAWVDVPEAARPSR